jgi:hypothetical protein
MLLMALNDAPNAQDPFFTNNFQIKDVFAKMVLENGNQKSLVAQDIIYIRYL